MRTYITLVLILLFGTVCGQDRGLIKETLDLVKEVYVINDPNPTHKSESDSIVQFLHNCIERHLREEYGKYNEELIVKGFKNLNKNSISSYEDSIDIRRMQLRRAACFASIALLSDLESGFTYLRYAKFDLGEEIKDADYEFLKKQYLGLMLIELLFEYEDKQSIDRNVSDIRAYLEKNKGKISDDVVRKTTDLLNNYKDKVE